MMNPNKSHPGNPTGLRGRPSTLPRLPDTLIIRLHNNNTLPCSIRADTPSGICGQPAACAYASLIEDDGSPWFTPGCWKFQPVCKACALAAMR
jgi:hypothetical protein